MTGQTAEAPQQRGTAPLTSRLRDEACRYQRVLERNSRDPQALVGVSLIALASGQSAPAVLMAQAAVAVAPAMGPAWVALSQALRARRPAMGRGEGLHGGCSHRRHRPAGSTRPGRSEACDRSP